MPSKAFSSLGKLILWTEHPDLSACAFSFPVQSHLFQLLGQYNTAAILLVCRCIWNVRDAEAWLMCIVEPCFGDVQIKSVYRLRDLWLMWLCYADRKVR